MKSIQRSTILVVVTVCALAVSTAAAQQGRRGGGFGGFGGGGSNLVTIAANEAVQKELGLSGDLSGKLTTLRDDYRAAVQKEYQTAGIDFQGFQDLSADERQKLTAKMTVVNNKLNDEFNPKVKSLVSSDQHKRLTQIQLQANLRNQGPSALTAAEVASELKLTDDQKKKLDDLNTEFARKQRELFTGGGGGNQEAFTKLREERTAKTMEVLTAEQKEKLNTLKGADFDVSQIGFGGGRRGKGNN
jgi:hypothetical protein